MLGLREGARGTAYAVPVELGKAREFARATKSESSGSGSAVPPTYLVTHAFWVPHGGSVLGQAKLDWRRLLSGGSEFHVAGDPIRPGEVLTASQRVRGIYSKEGRRAGPMTFIVFDVEFHRAGGSLAVRERHTTIQAGRAASSGGGGPLPERVLAGAPAACRPDGLEAATVAVGDQLPNFVDSPVTRTDIVRYQGASGDLNPIHHDDAYAQAAGYPTVFSVGMYHAGLLGSYLADLFGADNVRRFGVQFREQVWPGDVLTYSGQVTGQREDEKTGRRLLELEMGASRHGGGRHLLGTATIAV